MSGLLVDISVAVAVSVALWLLLPRGVVLTRSFPAITPDGTPLPDTWQLQNASAVPLRITAVEVRGLETMTPTKGAFAWIDLSPDDEDSPAATLHLMDEVSEIRRLERNTPWSAITIPPGDTLQARVLNNTDLRIRYRRSGWPGLFERRSITVSGGA